MWERVTKRSQRQYLWWMEPVVNEIVSYAKIMELELDKNDIDELVEEQSQELTTEELTELYCVPQQELMEESLSEKEEVIVKQESSSAIREMLEAWEAVASHIEKHLANKAVAVRATNFINDNVVPHFWQLLKRWEKQMLLDSFLVKKKEICIINNY
ncbi:hypothetical protein AVEN_88002-1 [Araneus ventricosus]|uniref:Uncharacterized protein n=1 Tax=Araneus ventricosus TaxID=182803 RepID=A0A4Y2G0Z4_ARAVE|nr:hypothetical protein AVEN_88002-1 [Araneus ventricosus]